jgi:hypothetical protein
MIQTDIVFYPATLWAPILIPVTVLALVLLFTNVHFRLAVVVVGALLILQTSHKLDVTKIAYLVGFSLTFAIALLRSSPLKGLHRSLLSVSLVVFALAGLSFFVAATHGASAANWLRDVTALLLLASAPIFALDAEVSGSAPVVATLFVITGLVAAVAFSTQYHIGGRLPGASQNRVALVTVLLPAALFSYSSAEALVGRGNRSIWMLISFLILVILLLSSRRSIFAIMLIPVVIMLAGGGSLTRGIIKLSLVIGATVLVFALVVGYFARSLEIRKDLITKRLATVVMVLENPKSDASFQARLSETVAATAAFLAEPALGVGPGHIFKFRSFDRKVRPTWAIVDTPMAIPAKYGLVGVGVFVVAGLAAIVFIRGLIRITGRGAPALALIGFGAFSVGRSLLGPPFDDKGYSMGLMFLLALCLIDAKAAAADGRGEQSSNPQQAG